MKQHNASTQGNHKQKSWHRLNSRKQTIIFSKNLSEDIYFFLIVLLIIYPISLFHVHIMKRPLSKKKKKIKKTHIFIVQFW